MGISSFIDQYLHAVEMQSRRFLRKRGAVQSVRVDAVWLVFALDGLLLAVTFAKTKMATGSLKQAIKDFNTAVPDLGKARDALAHFDEWRAGVGRKQTLEPDGTWINIMQVARDLTSEQRQGRIVVILGRGRTVVVDVVPALAAARKLAQEALREIDAYVAHRS